MYDGLSGRTDGIVYMKQVLYRNYLQQKYKTIGALNAAWGSNYTTFGSSNPSNPLDGWLSGTGTGLMDEDGVRHSWMKLVMPFQNIANLTGFPAQVKIDLDEVTEVMVEHFYNQYAIKFRAAYPNHLLMGPSALKHDLGFYKPGVLRAAGRVFDYLQMDYAPGPNGDVPSDLARSYNLAKKPYRRVECRCRLPRVCGPAPQQARWAPSRVRASRVGLRHRPRKRAYTKPTST